MASPKRPPAAAELFSVATIELVEIIAGDPVIACIISASLTP
jgi:hypothetical protein